MYKLYTNYLNILDWAREKGLDKADPNKQLLKVFEETGETCGAVAKNNIPEILDGIGDIFVTVAILCLQFGDIFNETLIDTVNLVEFEEEPSVEVMYEVSTIVQNAIGGYTRQSAVIELFVDLNMLAKQYGATLEQCVQIAYDVISKRKGKMINGVFVKQEDLKDNDIIKQKDTKATYKKSERDIISGK